jgi:hypothetical protein
VRKWGRSRGERRERLGGFTKGTSERKQKKDKNKIKKKEREGKTFEQKDCKGTTIENKQEVLDMRRNVEAIALTNDGIPSASEFLIHCILDQSCSIFKMVGALFKGGDNNFESFDTHFFIHIAILKNNQNFMAKNEEGVSCEGRKAG